ncbi:intercellular adhesion molecule 2-like isoform X3 [Camelus ferus]|uniref:Intercellular adhesion molecule 2-like isoform X3 n=2 Tax=Camelus TaxID=9836 RepID=A0A8B8R4Q3_CAMFR|nr:intercellular adhesion molecule 2 isoform X3 [Camelus bactrianus]XP_032312973.1 intercellular adhesion molecule 2-like isoform X3 [Camelus ferus]
MTGSPRLFPESLWTPLKMSPFCCWGLCVAFLALLCCPGSGEEAFEVHVSPEQPMVKHGGSQNSSMRCFFWCSRKQGSKSLNVGLYYPPKQVLLKLQPTRVAVGSPFTIECRVPSVAPLEGLTVTLLRGSEVLHSQTFEGTALSPQEAMVTYSAEAQLEDSSHNFSCQAKMDLRTRGVKVVDSVSDSQALEVFEPVQDNWMVIIVVVSVLLLFVTSVLLCFVFGQQGNQRRRGIYRVQAAWMRLRGTHPAQPA